MKKKWAFVAIFFFLDVLFLYGRSLRYDFVYDDHLRIRTNTALQSLSHLPLFFTDATTQASHPALQRDNYRPIGTTAFAVDYALWGLKPAGYRFENLLLHVLNGVLVFLIGFSILHLSMTGACIAGLFFLNHPLQVESVVWIVEKINLLGTAFILGGLWAWHRFRSSGEKKWMNLTYAALITGLFTRETVAVFPALLFLFDRYEKLSAPDGSTEKQEWVHYGIMSFLVLMYLVVRSTMIDQFKISGFWGGGLVTNIANVVKTWPLYLKLVIAPSHLRVTYSDLRVAESFVDRDVLFGLILFLSFVVAAIALLRRAPRLWFCLTGFLLFWLPASNIVPLTTLFGERFTYPMIVFAGLMLGLLVDSAGSPPARYRFPSVGFIVLVILGVYSALTWRHIPVWRNDYTLWLNATEAAPESWFGWACRGQTEDQIARRLFKQKNPRLAEEWLAQAETSLFTALKFQVPMESAGSIFLNLAAVNLKQGKLHLANEHARRATLLRPELQPVWDDIAKSDVVISSRQRL